MYNFGKIAHFCQIFFAEMCFLDDLSTEISESQKDSEIRALPGKFVTNTH